MSTIKREDDLHPDVIIKSAQVQLPFRCTREFSERLVRAKGSMMRITGQKVSDNGFFLDLLTIGLKEIERRYEPQQDGTV